MQDLREELTCPICMDLFREPRRLPCGHVYCRICLQDMLMKKYLNSRTSERVLSCPECRQLYDLTFQVAGVDIFPRDFKLMRLVELCKRASSGSRRASDDEDETAVKTVCTTSESAEATTAAYATGAPNSASVGHSAFTGIQPGADLRDRQPQAPNSLTREQIEAGLVSFGTPLSSLSDDSWIYIRGRDRSQWSERGHSPSPALASLRSGVHERTDDSWLLPSADGLFPVSGGLNVRGDAFRGDFDSYHGAGNLSSLNSGNNFSAGRYDNVEHENFQRYPVNESAARVPVRPSLPQLESSESSSESDSESDERGDEERSGDDDISGSEGDSQGRKQRRSRLSRFFRSLVMSDSDSWDEEEDQTAQAAVSAAGYPLRPLYYDCQQPLPPQGHIYEGPACLLPSEHIERFHGRCPELRPWFHPHGHQVHAGSDPLSGVSGDGDPPLGTRASGLEPGATQKQPIGEIQSSTSSENHNSRLSEVNSSSVRGFVRLANSNTWPSDSRSTEGHARTSEHEDQDGREGGSGINPCHYPDRDAVLEVDLGQRGASVLALSAAGDSAEAVASRTPLQPTPGTRRTAIESSDDSGDDYEAQTSMLHPRRKPRSRLKKFFTSLLSLSSSEDDEEEVEGQASPPLTSAPAPSVSLE